MMKHHKSNYNITKSCQSITIQQSKHNNNTAITQYMARLYLNHFFSPSNSYQNRNKIKGKKLACILFFCFVFWLLIWHALFCCHEHVDWIVMATIILIHLSSFLIVQNTRIIGMLFDKNYLQWPNIYFLMIACTVHTQHACYFLFLGKY